MSVASVTWLIAQHYQQLRVKRELLNGGVMTQNISSAMSQPITDDGYSLTTDNSSIQVTEDTVDLIMQTRGPYTLTVQDEVILALHGIIFILSLVGNGLVIATLVQNSKMRTITNIFLLNLAISDLLLAIFCMPFTVIPVVLKNFMFGPVMCIIIRYLQALVVSTSVFTLVAISLERFYAICNPLTSRKWQHMGHSYKVIAAIWVAALILNIPMAVFQKISKSPRDGTEQCLDMWPPGMQKVQTAYYVFLLIVADLLVPLTIMSVAYGLIARTLWKGFKSMQVVETPATLAHKAKRQMSLTSDASDVSDETEIPLTNGHTPSYYSNGCIPTSPTGSETPQSQFLFAPQNAQQTGSKMVKPLVSRQETTTSMRSHSSRSNIRSKKRVIKMLFVIVIEFFVCWTPLYFVYAWLTVDSDSIRKHVSNPQLTMSVLRLLAYTSSCCNPITYCFMSKKFRAAFLTVFKCRTETKPLNRRPTIQSTQVSFCENQQQSKTRLLSNSHSMNGFHTKTHLSVVSETSNSDMEETTKMR